MKVAILGGGESGVGAALLAKQKTYEVWLSDAGKISDHHREVLLTHQVPFEEGKHTWEQFFDANVVVKSPGIPPTAAFVQRLKEFDIEVISEIEFAARHISAPIIGITGSNGKTTTTALIHHMLSSAGVNAGLGGNIGVSLSKLLLEEEKEVYVVEISSFQLEDIKDFRPAVALFLNLTPDHLDRYQGSMELYGQAKLRIAENQLPEDVFIFSKDDPISSRMIEQAGIQATSQRFSLTSEAEAEMKNGEILIAGETWAEEQELPILGPHNQWNVMAALLAVKAVGLTKDQARKGLLTFQPIPHRLQPLGPLNGVSFINDSKATNVDAVKYALEAMSSPVIWMAGGVDKGNDYSELAPLIEQKVKALIILGSHDDKLRAGFNGPIRQVHTMSEAVKEAWKLSEAGDVVLLSPACASFDLFQNYEDRGQQFIKYVEELKSSS